MKDIFLKFLETQNLSTILAEIAVLFTAWASYKKYKDSKKKENTDIYKAAVGRDNINELIKSLDKHLDRVNASSALAEVTNGGGVPRVDKPIYIRALNTTDLRAFRFWGGDKTMCTPAIVKGVSEAVTSGCSIVKIEDIGVSSVTAWADGMDVTHVHYFIIGLDGKKRLLILAVNTNKSDVFVGEDVLHIIDTAAKIKEIINKSRKYFWQNKIN